MRSAACVAMVATAAIVGASPAHAQTARSGGAPNAQLMLQMQQLASERTSLQAENAKIKKELEDVKKERDTLKNAQKATDARVKTSAGQVAQLTAQRESAEESLKQTKDRMQELVAKFRETVQTLREIETDRNTNKQTLATRDQELKVCIDRNLALYKLNDELLTRIDKQSVFSRMAASEPFTRIKRIQNENLVDDYKARADDQRATPGNLKPSGPPAAPPKASAPPANPAPPAPQPGSSAPPK